MFMTSTNVSPEALKWTDGKTLVVRCDLSEARSFATSFCSKCGSPVPHATRSGREIIIPAGSLNDDPRTRPTTSVQWNSRARWAPNPTDLPIEKRRLLVGAVDRLTGVGRT